MISAAGIRRRFFGEDIKIDIRPDENFEKEVGKEGRFLYRKGSSDSIKGNIYMIFEDGKIIEHLGVKVEWIGQIGMHPSFF